MMIPGRFGTSVAVITALVALIGCEEPAGPLDRDVVNALTQLQGDEVGTQRSGLYILTAEPEECGCDLDFGLESFSACAWVELVGNLAGGDEAGALAAAVEATDGTVVMHLPGAPNSLLVGAMYDGGNVSVGSVTTLGTFAVQGNLITRIDGDFDLTDGEYEFEGELQHRAVGRTAIETEVGTDVDCVERVSLVGVPADDLFP